MKIVVISDSHGNIANLKHVLGFAEKIGAGAIIHCGDWDNIVAVETILSSKIPLYSVLGNADVDPEIGKRLKVKGKGFDDNFLKFEIDGRKIGITHSINNLVRDNNCDVVFCGHKHFKSEKVVNGVKTINPGPLYGQRPSFAVYDLGENRVEFVNL
jgi:putative phosphoesterase